MSTIKRLSAAAAILLAAGCSGGGGSNAVPKSPVLSNPSNPSQPAAPQSKVMTTVKIHIPGPNANAATRRHRAFVSAATSYVLVSETDSTFTNELTQVGTDVSAGSAACTNDNGGSTGSRTCTVQIDATPTTGSAVDYFEFDTYSVSEASAIAAPNTALSSAVPTAKRLGSARTQKAIVLDAANTISVALDGVIASYSVVPSVVSGDGSQPLSTQYALTALDASGETIVAGSADPYTDGTNYPLSFVLSDNPQPDEGPNSGYPAYSAFLTLTPGGPDATSASPPTSTFEQSADYLSASYTPHNDVTSYYDTISFTPASSALPVQSAIFSPIFIDETSSAAGSNSGTGSTNGNPPSFSQNDETNPSSTSGTFRSRVRTTRHRNQAVNSVGNNYPIVSFTAVGQNITVAPTEYVPASGTAQTFTFAPSSGCTTTGGPVVTVSPAAGSATSFTITATSNTQSSSQAGYSATDASGQPITACTISFTDTNGNSALLEITNTSGGASTIGVNTPTLLTADFGNQIVDIFDASGSNVGPSTLDTISPMFNPTGVAQDAAHDVFVGNYNGQGGVTEFFASPTPAYSSTEGIGNDSYAEGVAYHLTGSSSAPTAVLAVGSALGTVTVYDESSGSTNGNTLGKLTLPTVNASAPSVYGVVFDNNSDLYVSDYANAVVYEYTAAALASFESSQTSPTPTQTFKMPASTLPAQIAVDGQHNVFVADRNSGNIYIYATTNHTSTPTSYVTDGTGGSCTSYFGLALQSVGSTDTVYASCVAGNTGLQQFTVTNNTSLSPTYMTTATNANVTPSWISF